MADRCAGLTRILTAWQLPPADVVLVMPVRAHQPAKVRCAVDALRERFASTASGGERLTVLSAS